MDDKQKGFTLIEVMITVVIVAILATIAIPSYRSYVLKANRTEAKSTLQRLHELQEAHFINYNQYATSLGTPASATQLNFPTTTENGHYTISMQVVAGVTTFLQASTSGAQVADNDTCKHFLIRLRDGSRFAKFGASNTLHGTPDPCW